MSFIRGLRPLIHSTISRSIGAFGPSVALYVRSSLRSSLATPRDLRSLVVARSSLRDSLGQEGDWRGGSATITRASLRLSLRSRLRQGAPLRCFATSLRITTSLLRRSSLGQYYVLSSFVAPPELLSALLAANYESQATLRCQGNCYGSSAA